jgi:hypothetical protein
MKRETHRSNTGKKLYPMKNAVSRFKEIQEYVRAHARDLKRRKNGTNGQLHQ